MMRRLSAAELAHTEARPIFEPPPRAERAQASAVVHELLPFLEGELALSASQVDDLTLALERALLRVLARTHDDGAGL